MASVNKKITGAAAVAGALVLAMAIPAVAAIAGDRSAEAERDALADSADKAEALWTAKAAFDETSNQQLADENALTDLQLSVLSAIDASIPGIVCWGDSITAGVGGEGSTYPALLKELLRTELVSALHRHFPAEFTTTLTFDLAIPVVNMGVAGENSLTVAGRSGAIPYVVTEAFTIPADKQTAVRIKFESQTGELVEPLVQGSKGIGLVTVAGVEGRLELRKAYNEENRYAYYFTRSEEGEAVDVEAGSTIVTAAQETYKDYLAVIQLGHNGGFRDADDLIAQIDAVIAAQTDPQRYIVLGLPFGEETMLQEVNAALAAAYGDHFIDLWSYMREDGLYDAGIEPTIEDAEALEKGLLPVSLTGGATTFNAQGYRLIALSLERKIHELGYLDEVDALLEGTK